MKMSEIWQKMRGPISLSEKSFQARQRGRRDLIERLELLVKCVCIVSIAEGIFGFTNPYDMGFWLQISSAAATFGFLKIKAKTEVSFTASS